MYDTVVQQLYIAVEPACPVKLASSIVYILLMAPPYCPGLAFGRAGQKIM